MDKLGLYALMPKNTKLFVALDEHKKILSDRRRLQLFKEAISQAVSPGCVVADIGTGVGIFACYCILAGAKRVYAIEEAEIVELAKKIVAQNNMEKQVVVIPGNSMEVTLPEQVDVVVAEVLGNFGLEESILDAMIDARERFLRPDGTLIPYSLRLFLVPLEAAELHNKLNFWLQDHLGIDLSPAMVPSLNNAYVTELDPAWFLSKPQGFKEIVFNSAEGVNVFEILTFRTIRPGKLTGLGGWFVTKLWGDIQLTTSPLEPASHWQQCFFPLEYPVDVDKGDFIKVEFESISMTRDVVWNWLIQVEKGSAYQNLRHSPIIQRLTTSKAAFQASEWEVNKWSR